MRLTTAVVRCPGHRARAGCQSGFDTVRVSPKGAAPAAQDVPGSQRPCGLLAYPAVRACLQSRRLKPPGGG